jgi:hypothetical protein
MVVGLIAGLVMFSVAVDVRGDRPCPTPAAVAGEVQTLLAPEQARDPSYLAFVSSLQDRVHVDFCARTGRGWPSAICRPRAPAPRRPANLAPCAGCDQRPYGNDCARETVGVQLDHTGPCVGDGGGDVVPSCADCDPATQYCGQTVGGVDRTLRFVGCIALPSGCGATPSCVCVGNIGCASVCAAPSGGPVTVTCQVP